MAVDPLTAYAEGIKAGHKSFREGEHAENPYERHSPEWCAFEEGACHGWGDAYYYEYQIDDDEQPWGG